MTKTHEFHKWMARIQNQYYAQDNLMAIAFKRLEANEEV